MSIAPTSPGYSGSSNIFAVDHSKSTSIDSFSMSTTGLAISASPYGLLTKTTSFSTATRIALYASSTSSTTSIASESSWSRPNTPRGFARRGDEPSNACQLDKTITQGNYCNTSVSSSIKRSWFLVRTAFPESTALTIILSAAIYRW
jgi:hypothetical protein